jgi:hypothetical protein
MDTANSPYIDVNLVPRGYGHGEGWSIVKRDLPPTDDNRGGEMMLDFVSASEGYGAVVTKLRQFESSENLPVAEKHGVTLV